MVSEPNFVLDIKQTSLTSKRRFSHAHHHQKSQMLVCWIQISQHLAVAMAHYCVQIQKLKHSCDLTYQMCTSSLFLMKPTRQKCSMAYRDQNPRTRPPMAAARATTREQRLLELSHAPPKILDSQLGSQSHAPPRRPCRPPIHLAWESGNHLMTSSLHVSMTCHQTRKP